MAFVTETRSFEAGIVDRLTVAFKAWAETRAKRKMYNVTVRELSALSGRDLADLGIARAEISRVAREATYGA